MTHFRVDNLGLVDCFLQVGADLVVVGSEASTNNLTHMLFVVVELLNLSVEGVLLKLELLRLLTKNLCLDLFLQIVHVLFEESEKSARAVQLVDKLIAFLEELG